MKVPTIRCVLHALLATAALCLSAAAQNRTWSGSGSDDNWTTAANWVEGSAPVPAGNVTLSFNGTTTSRRTPNNDFAPDSRFFALKTSGSGNFTFTGNQTVLGDAGSSSTIFETLSGGGHVTVDVDLSINEGIASFVMRGGATINGRLTNFTAPNFNNTYSFAGGNRITLTNPNNSFGQGVDVSGGATLVISQWIDKGLPSQLGAGNFTKLGNAGAAGTIEYTGPETSTNRTVTLGDNAANATFTGSATIRNNGTGALTFTSPYFNAQTNNTTLSNRTLTLAGNFTGAPNVIQGAITDNNPSAKISLVKSDACTWRLDGNNTYTGNTTVSGGTLVLNGNCSAATGTISVAANAALELGPSAVLGGAVTSSGRISPGLYPGNLTLNSTASVALTVNGTGSYETVAGDGGDTLALGNGATLELDFTGYTPSVGHTFTLFPNWATRTGNATSVSVVTTGLQPPYALDTTNLIANGTVSIRTVAGSPVARQSDGTLLRSSTGQRFYPTGFNFVRLDGSGNHSTFSTSTYNGTAATAMLQRLARAGYTAVRVFTNVSTTSESGVGWQTNASTPLNPTYLDNVADFLQRAAAEGILVQPSMVFFPRNDKYNSFIGTAPPMVTGNNLHYLDPGYIAAKEAYLADFWSGIRSRYPDCAEALLCVDLGNELNFHVPSEPFSLASGTFNAANGQTYDLATQKQDLADGMAVYWVNRMAAAVRSVLPDTLINTNVFTYDAVTRTGAGDFRVFGADWKDRVPFRPRALVQSDTDIVDLHFYWDSLAESPTDLGSIEFSTLKSEAIAAGKVLTVGEFGALYADFPDTDPAAALAAVPTFAQHYIDQGFQGWLFWTYDTAEQVNHHLATDANFAIFNHLAQVIPGGTGPELADNFGGSSFSSGWFQTTPASWSVTGGAATLAAIDGMQQIYQYQDQNIFTDFRATTRFQFTGNGTGWGGIVFRKQEPDTAAWGTGYNLFMTAAGKITLNVYEPTTGSSVTLGTIQTPIDPFADFVDLTVEAVGTRIKVWANGTLYLDVTDDTWGSGYVSFSLYNIAGKIDLVSVNDIGQLPYERFGEIPWQLTGNTDTPGAYQTLAVSGALDFGKVRFLRPDFSQGVDWSSPFWQGNRSWKVISSGGLTNFANLRLVSEDWPDAQGDTFSSALAGRQFVLRQDGGDVWLDLVTPSPREIHVAKTGSDANPGTAASPYLTIGKAAQVATAGDTVVVHAGIYREHVKPANGGFPGLPITYMAAPGEIVEIKGSNQYADWTNYSGNTWQRVFAEAEFGGYNPYLLEMTEAYLDPATETIHRKRGEVFLNGAPLTEKQTLSQVTAASNSWAASADGLTVYANFGGANPNTVLAEIVMREQIFAPEAWNLGHIHVKGFLMEHSANDVGNASGAATAALSTSGGHDWVIEENIIQWTKSFGAGIGLVGPTPSITRAGWNIVPARYGHHVFRGNTLRDIGTGGMHSFKGAFCLVEGNRVIRCNRLDAGGAEKAGIKFVWFGNDVVIRNNYFYKNNVGGGFCAIWLDAGTQGARVYGNTFVDNDYAVWFERQLGPVVFDNNVMLNCGFRISDGGGVLMAHNFIARMASEDSLNDHDKGGAGTNGNDSISTNNLCRFDSYGYISTAYFEPHTLNHLGDELTKRARLHWRNNILVGNLDHYLPPTDANTFDNYSNHNVFLNGAKKSAQDANSVVSSYNPGVAFTADDYGVTLSFSMDATPFLSGVPLLTHAYVGELNRVVNHTIDTVNTDFFGAAINASNPVPGPFANLRNGSNGYVTFRAARDLGDPLRDGDFDGMSDAAETAAGRDSADPADLAFEFNTNGDFEGWTNSALTSPAVSGGVLTGTASSSSTLTREGLYLPGNAISNILFRETASKAATVKLRWARADDHTYDSSLREISLSLAASTPKSLVAALSSHPEWAGRTITGLRILPASSSTTSVTLDWVRTSTGDFDNDGIPDSPEFSDGYDAADAADALLDLDGDGSNRLAEYIWGTSDANGSSNFQTDFTMPSSGDAILSWDGLAGRNYRVWRSYTLAVDSWQQIHETGALSTNQTIQIEDEESSEQNRAFYRIEAEIANP